MKKTLLTLVLTFCVLAGQGQTSTTASGVNTTELNSKWAQFTQLAEKKQYKQRSARQHTLYRKQTI